MQSQSPAPANLSPAERLALNKEFYTAAHTKDPAEIERLFNRGADIHFHHPDYSGTTPLYAAAYYGRESAVELLLHLKADINRGAEPTHDTPMIAAVHRGYADVCRLLLKNGAKLLIADTQGLTPLSLAFTNTPADKKSMIQTMLIEHLVTQYQQTNDPAILTHIDAISKKHDAPLKEKFDELIDPPKKAQRELNEALYLAARTQTPDDIFRLLERGADINFQNPKEFGCTPLYNAAAHGMVENAKLLLVRKAAVDKSDSGDTPLFGAASLGHLEICRMLLDNGANPLTVNNSGFTILRLTQTRAPADKRVAITNMILENIVKQSAKLILEDKNSESVIAQIKQIEVQHKTALYFKLILTLLTLGMPVEKMTALLPKNLNEYYDSTIQDDVCKYIADTEDMAEQLKLCEQSLWVASHPFYHLVHLPRRGLNSLTRTDALQTIKKLLESILQKDCGLMSTISDATRAAFNQELIVCARKNDVARMRILCKIGADVNYRGPICGCTPLIEAIIADNADCVVELLMHDIDAAIPASGPKSAFNEMAQTLSRNSRIRLQEFLLRQPNHHIEITPAQFADITANAQIKKNLSLRTPAQPVLQTAPVVATSTGNFSAPPSLVAAPRSTVMPLTYQRIYPQSVLAQESPVSLLPPPPSYLEATRSTGVPLEYQHLPPQSALVQRTPEAMLPPPPSYQEATRITGVPLHYRQVQVAPSNGQSTEENARINPVSAIAPSTLFYHGPRQAAVPETTTVRTLGLQQINDIK